jgi:hypothetical protein
MVRPPHLPPIGNEEAKRKWELMNRPSIMRLHFGPRKDVKINHNYMPVYNLNSYNNRRTLKNQGICNPDHEDYQELSSIIKYIILAVIVLTLIIVFWWILIPITIIFAIYKIIKVS